MLSIVWFEIPADDVRACPELFTARCSIWKIEKFPGPMQHLAPQHRQQLTETACDGGLMKRQHPQQGITNYVAAPSVDQIHAKGPKTRRQCHHVQDGRASDGLLGRLPGY